MAEDKDGVEKFADYVPEQKMTETLKVEKVEKAEPVEPAEDTSKKVEGPLKSKPSEETPKEPIKTRDRVLASPVARKLAAERGIPLDQITGTGPKDRIVKADVLSWVPPAKEEVSPLEPTLEPTSDYIDVPLSNMRRIIAERLSLSSQTIPHYFLTIEVDMDKVLKLREDLNKDSNGKYKLSINDFIIKSSALTLLDFPQANSSWHETFIRQYVDNHIF